MDRNRREQCGYRRKRAQIEAGRELSDCEEMGDRLSTRCLVIATPADQKEFMFSRQMFASSPLLVL